MKAPEKVYVHPGAHLGMLTLTTIHVDAPGEEIYIRKDALIEWATNLKERWKEPPVSVHSPGCVYMLEQVINKINSL